MKNKNSLIIGAIVVVIVGAASFLGGIQYQKMQRTSFGSTSTGATQVGQRGQGGQFFSRTTGSRPVSGEIISTDENSITVKEMDGSTKIIILSDKTTINKTSEAKVSDLKIGEKVTALGTANADGSITAQNVGVGMTMMFRGGTTGGRIPSGQPVQK